MGPRAGLLPDDRRARRRRGPPRADLQGPRPGRRSSRPHAGPDRRPERGRAGLPPLRPEWRRPLREDGPQRDRVRPDGGLRRGPEHPPPRRSRPIRPAGGRRDGPPARAGALPVRARPAGGHRGLATRQRRRLVAARPDRPGVPGQPRPGRLRRARLGLGRGPLDEHRRDRRERSGPGPDHGPLRALHLARRVGLRRPDPVGDAARLRRPPRDGGPRRRWRRSDRRPVGRLRLLRRDRRPCLQADLPGPGRIDPRRGVRPADHRRGPFGRPRLAQGSGPSEPRQCRLPRRGDRGPVDRPAPLRQGR